MKSFKTLINEASSNRVHQRIENRNIGMITAHRAENTTEENRKNNSDLEDSIRKAGHGFVKVNGHYTENRGTPQEKHVKERSYLVIGKKGDDNGALKGFLLKHGEKHKQDSVLHKAAGDETAKLHGTKEGGWPGKGQTHDVGKFHPDRAGEFHSSMRGAKKTFAFESIQFTTPLGFFSREETEF